MKRSVTSAREDFWYVWWSLSCQKSFLHMYSLARKMNFKTHVAESDVIKFRAWNHGDVSSPTVRNSERGTISVYIIAERTGPKHARGWILGLTSRSSRIRRKGGNTSLG